MIKSFLLWSYGPFEGFQRGVRQGKHHDASENREALPKNLSCLFLKTFLLERDKLCCFISHALWHQGKISHVFDLPLNRSLYRHTHKCCSRRTGIEIPCLQKGLSHLLLINSQPGGGITCGLGINLVNPHPKPSYKPFLHPECSCYSHSTCLSRSF